MRIAVLILAHKNRFQLESLVKRFCVDFDVYIHLDSKSDIPADYFSGYANVTIFKHYKVNWGSYNQILATYDLFKAAHQQDYDYYYFISGQDLPLKSNQELKAFAKTNSAYSFVNNEQLPKKQWLDQGNENGGFDRIEYYWWNNFDKNLWGYIRKKALKMYKSASKIAGKKRELFPITYYGGWNWVNLNREAMSTLINFVANNPDYIPSFRYTNCADELWVQTILMNSDCKVINDNLRFLVWPYKSANPKVLTMDDFEKLSASGCLFARKFDSTVDKEVMNKVYALTEETAVVDVNTFNRQHSSVQLAN